MTAQKSSGIPRRGLLLGAGAAAVGTTLGTSAPSWAVTPTAPDPFSHTTTGARKPSSTPVISTFASPPESGVVYRYCSYPEFIVDNPAARFAWGGQGAYPSGGSANLIAHIDIPAGAQIHDIEWYTYNNNPTPLITYGRLWVAGIGDLFTLVADGLIPAGPVVGPPIKATRVVVPQTTNGPYPSGTKLVIAIPLASTGLGQVSGARVGFIQGGGMVGTLAGPIRIYDSRVAGGQLLSGHTRTITVPGNIFSPGVTAVLANITAVGGQAPGNIRVFPAGGAFPASSSLNFVAGIATANSITVGLSKTGQFNVYTSKNVDFIIDITGVVG